MTRVWLALFAAVIVVAPSVASIARVVPVMGYAPCQAVMMTDFLAGMA